MSTFKRVKTAVERDNDGHHIGTLMWWSLRHNDISQANLRLIAQQEKLPFEYLPNDIKPHSAFKRAIRHASTKLDKDYLLRTIADDKNELIIGLVHERKDEINKDLRYQIITRITFEKNTGRINHDVDNYVVDDVRGLYQIHMNHGTDDIRIMMTNFLQKAGVAIRPSGGVYFIPAQYQTVLDALCRVVERVGSNNTFQIKVPETDASKETLAVVTQACLEEDIRQIEEDLDKFVFEKARERTLERKLASFEQLRSRAQMFSSVLSFKVSSITDKIDKAKAIVQGHLGVVTVAPVENTTPEPATPPQAFNEEAGF